MFGKVHIYEKLFDLDIPIIEDVTLSLGVKINYSNKKRIIISSFHSSKVISAVEGGIVATNNQEFYKKLVVMNDMEELNKSERIQSVKEVKYNIAFSFRPSELNFIWGFLQLKSLKQFVKERQRIAKIYIEKLDSSKYEIPNYDENNMYFRFIIGLKKHKVENVLKYMAPF